MDKPLGKDGGVSGELSNLGAFGAAIAAAIKHNTEQLEVSGGTVSAAIDRNTETLADTLGEDGGVSGELRNLGAFGAAIVGAIDRNTAQMERMEAFGRVAFMVLGPETSSVADAKKVSVAVLSALGVIRAEKQAGMDWELRHHTEAMMAQPESEGGDRGIAPESSV